MFSAQLAVTAALDSIAFLEPFVPYLKEPRESVAGGTDQGTFRA